MEKALIRFSGWVCGIEKNENAFCVGTRKKQNRSVTK